MDGEGADVGSILGGIARTPVSPAQTGLVLGAAAAAWSLRPSLLPRDEATQAAVSVGSFALGAGVGAGLNKLLSRGTTAVGATSAASNTYARLGVLAVGTGIGVLAVPDKLVDDLPFSNTIQSAGRIALVTGLGSLGAQAHSYTASRLAKTPMQRVLVNGALLGAELVGLGVLLEHRRRGFAKRDRTTPTARTALVAGGAVAGAYVGARGMSAALRATPGWAKASLGAAAGAMLLGGAAWRLLRPKAPAQPLTVREGTAGAVGPNVGAGEYDTLDAAGVRFLQGTLPKAQIERVRGRPAQQPIRVAVGLHSAASPEARAKIAIDRMRQAGAFDRRDLFVAVSPGAGIIDDELPASVELFGNGDVASVAIPYSDKASALSLDKIDEGARTLDALLDGIEAESDERRARGEQVPRVLLYGNSLGAWSGQEAFKGSGVQGVLDRVDRVLWVGNPGPSGWRNDVVFPRDGAHVSGRDRVLEFSEVAEVDALTQEQRERIGIWMHTRASDPVAKIDADMLWRRPLYLRGEHREDARVPKNAAYVPGVSFLQELGDIITTSRIADDPDRQAEGHTYVVDIVPDVATAYYPRERDPALQHRIQRAVTSQASDLRALRDRQQRGE